MMNLRQPQSLPLSSSPVELKTTDASAPAPLAGEFDKDLKKNIEQLMQSGELNVGQVKVDPAPLPTELKNQGNATAESGLVGIKAETGIQSELKVGTVLTTQLPPKQSQSLDSLLASVPVQPAHSQSGKVKLPNGMVPVHETLTPSQMEVLGKQLEAEELAMNGEAELVSLKSPVQQASGPKAKKSLSGEDFLLARSLMNQPSQIPSDAMSGAIDAKSPLKANTAASVSGTELNMGLAALAASRRNSDQTDSGDRQEGKDQDQQLSKLAQGLGASPMAKAAGFESAMAKVETNANVVPGSLGTQRLSHDAIASMGQTIQSFSGNGSGGEMKLRLKPDQLGEVFIQVSTLGNKVDLKVRASDDNAKKIIEESLSALKDQLGVHQLSLGSIDVSTAPAPTQSQSQTATQFDMNQNAKHFGQEMNQGSERDPRESSERLQRSLAQSAMNASGLKRSPQASGPGRLNVMA